MRTVRRRRGANAIEFGLTLPVFVLIVFGMIDFGWYFHKRAGLNGANLDGCRAGAIIDTKRTDTTPVAEAKDKMMRMLGIFGMSSATTTVVLGGAVPGRYLDCTLEANFTPLIGAVPFLPTKVTSHTRARLEWQRASTP